MTNLPRAYYNEFDPYAAQWLRNLIAAGHIAPGDVDERSIEDVSPGDIRGYTQCHFFAGIGVWSLALRRAGWPDDRPIWTGSCPCQPFSAAGKGAGFADERHLWPAFHWLIEQCRPAVVLGEQVASKDGLGWLDLVQADLEGTGYASRAVDLCAAGVGAPHIRQRLWWVGERLEHAEGDGRLERRAEPSGRGAAGGCGDERLADPEGERRSDGEAFRGSGRPLLGETERVVGTRDRLPTGRVGDDDDDARLEGQRGGHRAEIGHGQGSVRPVAEAGQSGRLADTAEFGRVRWRPGSTGAEPETLERSARLRATSSGQPATGPTNGHWRDADWLFCRDGMWRPVEPGTFPLAHGAAARVGRLRAYGNAIVAQAAQTFIEAYLDTRTVDGFRLTEVSLSSRDQGVFG